MNPLKLTAEDIERAQRQAQATPPMPEVIKIGDADLPTQAGGRIQHTASPLKITPADLEVVPPVEVPQAELAALEHLMFEMINEARNTHLPSWLGKVTLAWHAGLAAVARGHSADMLKRQYVEHKSPEGVTAAQRISRYGVRYIACGENIGVVYGAASHGAQGVRDIHNAFMDQPRSLTNHRGNLLNPIWTHVGVGVAYKPDGALIATQNFMSAPGAR